MDPSESRRKKEGSLRLETGTLGALWLLFVFAGLASGDEIRLRNGTTVRGTVVSATEQLIEIRLDGTRELVRISAQEIDARTHHALRAVLLEIGDGAEHLALAHFALANGLLDEADASFQAAGRSDPALAEPARDGRRAVFEARAQALRATAQATHRAGNPRRAMDLFRRVLFEYPTSRAATRVTRELRELVEALEAHHPDPPKIPSPSPGPAPPPRSEETARLLSRAHREEEHADRLLAEALQWDGRGNVSRADRTYQESVQRYRRSIALLRKVQRTNPEPITLSEVEQRAGRLWSQIAEALLSRALLHAAERNLARAQQFVEASLRIEPTHRQALQLRQWIADRLILRPIVPLPESSEEE